MNKDILNYTCKTYTRRQKDLSKLAKQNNFYAKAQLAYEHAKRENRETYFSIHKFLPLKPKECLHKQPISNIPTINSYATTYEVKEIIVNPKTKKVEQVFSHKYRILESTCYLCGKTLNITIKKLD